MSVIALLFTIFGAVVALFYTFESCLSLHENGLTTPLLVIVLVCGIGVYFFWRNARTIKRSSPDDPWAKAA